MDSVKGTMMEDTDAARLLAEAFQAKVIADFLREGGYANLGEAMERLEAKLR